MKETFQYISDLHLDENPFSRFSDIVVLNPKNKDKNLIIAGDIASINYPFYESFIRYCCYIFDDVFLIAGNHEYYGSSIDLVEIFLSHLNRKYKNLHYLQMDSFITKKGNHILGCTLWSYSHSKLNVPISNFNIVIRNVLFQQCLLWLQNTIKPYSIVITHHAPSLHANSEKFNKNDYSLYCTNLDFLVEKCKKWICGHTHKKMNKDKLLSNPRGYAFENLNYNKEEMFEV